MKLWIEKTAWASRKCRALVPSIRPENVASIAVIKHGALGDLILTRPFLVSLRKLFPNAKTTLSLAQNYMHGAPSDLVDRTHVSVAASAPGESPLSSYRSFRSLGRHELLFDLTETARSRWISLLNPAALKVGFVRSDLSFPLARFIYDLLVARTEYKFESETFLDQLRVLGCDIDQPPDFGFGPRLSPEGGGCVIYFPTASHRGKCWPATHFSHLLGMLSSEFRTLRHIVAAGVEDWEKETAKEIVEPWLGSPNVEVLFEGRGAFDIIRKATLMISNDTGMRNYAIAAGTPTIGIFFCTPPFRYQPGFGFHRVVFSADASMPSCERVLHAARGILKDIQDKRVESLQPEYHGSTGPGEVHG